MSHRPALLDALHFLLGRWQAISLPGEATGSFRFVPPLNGRVIVRSNYAEYPATSERPAYRHDDLMIIFCDDSQALQADYYDSEGHVIRYSGQVVGPDQVIFLSQPSPAGPGFRLAYQLDTDGVLKGEFEIVPFEAPDTFVPYLSWSARKEVVSNEVDI